jgi:putative transposase
MTIHALIHYFGATYHITTRDNNRADIFSDREDRELYMSILSKTIQKYEYQLHAFCLMTYHVHLLFQVGDAPISHIMHNIKQ